MEPFFFFVSMIMEALLILDDTMNFMIFYYFCQVPEVEFLDADMEGLRSRVLKMMFEISDML